MAYFKSLVTAIKKPDQKADGAKKKSNNEKSSDVGTEPVAEAEEVKDTDKKAEEAAPAKDETETADANNGEKSNENDTGRGKESAVNGSDEMHEKISEVVTAANPDDSETCEQKSSDADKKAEEEDVVTADNSRTEVQESEQTASGDVVTMDVDNVDVSQLQSSTDTTDSRPTESGQCSSSYNADDKNNDNVEAMETDAADNNSGVSADGGISQQGKHETCLLYTSPSPRDRTRSRMPSSA